MTGLADDERVKGIHVGPEHREHRVEPEPVRRRPMTEVRAVTRPSVALDQTARKRERVAVHVSNRAEQLLGRADPDRVEAPSEERSVAADTIVLVDRRNVSRSLRVS